MIEGSDTEAAGSRLVPWGPQDALLAIGLAFALFVASDLLIIPVINKDHDSKAFLGVALFATFLWQLSIIGVARFIAARHGAGWRELGARLPFGQSTFDLGRSARLVGGSLAAAYLVTIIYGLIATATGLDALKPQKQLPDNLFAGGWLTIAAGFSLVLAAPIAEELLFRGTIFAGLMSRLSFWPAALISGLLFAVAHAQSGLIIPFTVVGMILANVYYRGRSIYLNMSVHALFNLLSFTFLVLGGGKT